MSQPTAHPFALISSAARAFPEYLREALDVCLRHNLIPVMTERPPAGEPEAVEAALGLVKAADLYIGIFGADGGHVPPGADLSMIRLEYERATRHGIPRLVFLTDQKYPREAAAAGPPEASEHEAFLAGLKTSLAVNRVGSAEEFRDRLSDALGELGLRGIPRGGGKRPASKRVVRVFVASPRDVQDERSRMPKVVESLNRTVGKLLNVVVELWRWEADGVPAVGSPQSLADVELDAADVVLVIFWNRLGTPASAAGTTGTEGEVLRALERWSKARRPQVMVYFSQRPARLDRPELEQRLKLLEFREHISPLVLIVDYEDAQEFEWRVRDDLFTTIARLCVRRK